MKETDLKPFNSVSKSSETGLSRKQRECIPHLIGARSLEEGYRKAKLSKATYFRYMREDLFRSELEKARADVIAEALVRLKASVSKAVDGLILLMDGEQEGTRFRACQTTLDFFFRNREIEELENRLEKIERIILEKRTYR
jgi:hypothetical protein